MTTASSFTPPLSPTTNAPLTTQGKSSSVYDANKVETTSTKSSGNPCGLSNTCLLITLVVLSILFLAILIIGALLPTIVWNIMFNELNDRLPIGPDTYNERSWNRFLNTSTNSHFYVYNFTNLNEVLATGNVKPNFNPVGPVKFKKWYTKFDLEWNQDRSTVSYYEARNYEPLDSTTYSLMDEQVVAVNTIYLGGMAQVMRSVAGPISNGHQPGYFPNGLNEQYFYGGVVTSNVFPTLSSQLLNSSSTLASAFRLGSIKIYFGWSMQRIAATMSLTQAQIVGAWATAAATFAGTQYDGMRLLQALPELDKASILVSPSNPYSFMHSLGNSMWIGAIAGNATLRGALMAGNNITLSTFSVVATWIGYTTGTANYTAVVMNEAIPATIQSVVPGQPGLVPTTWSELILLQFSTGLVLNVTSPGLYRSVVDMLGASSGLLAATGVPKAPEYAIGAQDFCNLTSSLAACQKAANAPYMTIAMATNLLQFFSGTTNPNALTAYLTLAQLLPVIINSPDMQATYLGLRQNPTYSALLNQPFIAATNGTNAGQLYAYLYGYLGQMFTGHPLTRDAMGISTENGGLFFRTSIRSILFGVQKDGSPAMTAQNSQLRAVSLGRELGAQPFAAYLDDYRSQYTNRKFILNTGRNDIYKIGQYEAYQGVSRFWFNCELVDPYNLTTCSTAAGRATNDWQIYGEPENLVGTSNNLQSTPFAVRNQDPIPSLTLFIPEISRNVHLNYTSERTVKGIHLRTYTIDERHLVANIAGYNVTTNPLKNEPRYYTARAPNGMAWAFGVFGGTPLALTLPHMLNVDPNVTSRITGQNPDPELHTTAISIEPITGLTMQAQKRLQSNFRITRSELNWNNYYANIFNGAGSDEVYVPYYYVDEHNTVEDQDADYYKDNVGKALDLGDAFQIVGCVVGGFFLIVCIVLLVLFFRRGTKSHSHTESRAQLASMNKV